MKKTFLLLALALPSLAQQNFDIHSLDKFGAFAHDKTEVNLDSNLLKLAARFLGDDQDAAPAKDLLNNVTGIYVRSYTFDQEGQYGEADLAALRASLRQPNWNKILESREGRETSGIYFQPLPDGRLSGVAIISTAPKELTVVLINGILSPGDIDKFSGTMGVPDLKSLKDLKKLEDKTGKSKGKED